MQFSKVEFFALQTKIVGNQNNLLSLEALFKGASARFWPSNVSSSKIFGGAQTENDLKQYLNLGIENATCESFKSNPRWTVALFAVRLSPRREHTPTSGHCLCDRQVGLDQLGCHAGFGRE